MKASTEKQEKPVWWIIPLSILGFLFLAVGVPLIINSCYKATPVFVTKWNAEDVLSYYGTLLGAVSTILALVCTISFTKKQIQRSWFLERSRAKWEMVETIVTQALVDISPLKMWSLDKTDDTNAMIRNRIRELHSYVITAKTSLSMIKCYINPDEYKHVAVYVGEISCAIAQFYEIEKEFEQEYMTLQTVSVNNSGNIPNAELILHFGRTNKLMERIVSAHDGPYQRLLNMKRDVFEKIYADIDAQADQILKFGRKR